MAAKSDVSRSLAIRFAKSGYDLQLAARDIDGLSAEKARIEKDFSVSVSVHKFDALDTENHENFLDSLPKLPAVAICAVGLMGSQYESQNDQLKAAHIIRSNFEGPATILASIANKFEKRGSGVIVGISSVAGERGRATNYVYGSAKAGFTAYLSGLRNRLACKGVHVVTVLPGYIDTKMLQGLNPPKQLTAQSDDLAEVIFHAVLRKKNIIYYKRVWRLIILLIKIIPENFFKRMNL